MSRQIKKPLTWTLIVLIAATGCHPTQPFYFHNDGDLSHYLKKVTDVEHPDIDNPPLAEVANARAPLTVSNPEFTEIWDLSLQECVNIALQNSKVIRNAGAIQANFGFSDALIERIPGLPTAYDPGVAETNVISGPASVSGSPNATFLGAGFGELQVGSGNFARASTQGVQDALSDFDAQFTSGFVYNTTDRPQNINGIVNQFQAPVFRDNTGTMGFGVSKKTASGALFTIRNLTTADVNNTPINARPISGDWITTVETIATMPLMRGRGVQINRLPIVLARINTDISIADFEAGVRNMLMDLEAAYWDLHFAYRNLEATKIGRDSSLVTWKIVYEKWNKGVSPVQDEAQARGQYFQFRAGVETSLRDLYTTETRVRWLMGLAATDGRLIRPKDEPSMARVEFDWQCVHQEAMFRSTELRQQKWRMKQRELELVSAKNQLLPQLNASALYRWLGRGDQLVDSNRNGLNFPAPGSTAVGELTSGQYTEASASLTFIPGRIGLRRELSAVRNAQLQIARSKAQLEEMELNLSHLLTTAVRELDANFILAQSHFNRWVAAEKEVESLMALFEGGKQTLDLVLDAQRRRATAQSDYYRALTDYNKSLAFVHFRKGSLLEHNGVGMSEGPWPEKAYWDAYQRARERDSSYFLQYGWTRPNVVSRGPAVQETGTAEYRSKTPGGPMAQPLPQAESVPAGKSPQTPESDSTPDKEGPTTFSPQRMPTGNASATPNYGIRQTSANVPVESFNWGNVGQPTAADAAQRGYTTSGSTSSRRRAAADEE